jgi:hypothetical protein
LSQGALRFNTGAFEDALRYFEKAADMGDRRASRWIARIQSTESDK